MRAQGEDGPNKKLVEVLNASGTQLSCTIPCLMLVPGRYYLLGVTGKGVYFLRVSIANVASEVMHARVIVACIQCVQAFIYETAEFIKVEATKILGRDVVA